MAVSLLYKIEIPNYPIRILLSKARRAKYKLNKKGEKVITNKAFAGKPRYKSISGQDLWTLSLNRGVKGKISSELKHFYYEYFRDLKPITQYPIGISLMYYGKMEQKPDLDNLNMFHLKCILDA